MARLAPPSPKLLPPLVEALASDDGDVRWAASRILVDAGRLHGEVLPLLLGLLARDERAAVRRMAAFALRELAPGERATSRALVDATRDADRSVRRAAVTALAALLDPEPAVSERLAELLCGDADAATRRLAAVALGALGERSPASLPSAALERLSAAAHADEGDRDLARAAALALARIRREGSPA